MGAIEERTLKIKKRELISGEKVNAIAMPSMHPQLIKLDNIVPNYWNPNKMQHKIMRLLILSILEDGFLFPIIVVFDDAKSQHMIIDGFHRYKAMTILGAKEIPCVILNRTIEESRIITLRMNKTRGVHQLEGDKDNFKNILESGKFTLSELSQKMALEAEEIVIYKKKGSIIEEFRDQDFSNAWERDQKADIMYKPQKDEYDEYDEDEM